MKTPFLTLAAVLAATCAFAGPEILIKQRAKEARNQNNVRQGVPVAPPPQPAAPATPGQPARPTGGLSPAAQQNIATFQADLAAMKTKPPLAAHLTAAALGAAKPSPDAIAKLAADLQTALTGVDLGADSQLRLARELNATVNGTNLSRDQIKAITADAQAILQAAGVKRPEAAAVADDMKAVINTVKKAAGL